VPAEPAARALRRDARRNREQIVASARALFASGGVDVPVDEIARHAGVGVGTLYRHYPRKDDLVDAVLEEALDAYVALAHEAAADADAWTGLTAFFERALALHASNRALREVLVASEHGRARAQAARELARPLLSRIVERAQTDGRLRHDLTAEDITVLLWAVARVIETTGGVSRDLWRRYLSLILDGLRPEVATPLPVPAPSPRELARAALGRDR